ncbi:MAG TPA: radical SAM protein [Blastocatellia bacterium]|nr:radical SAM protein [Blastocatellia bacterium]
MSSRQFRAIWEITLQCNLACAHCGSRAGKARTNELNTDEALDLVRQLAEVGIEEVALIGGEAYLRRDWLTIAAAIANSGMLCTMTTGGYGISDNVARQMREAGIYQCSVSIDGLEKTHDRLRGRNGSWQACFETLERLNAVGILPTCNTQINRLSAPEMPLVYSAIRDAGVKAWQIQLTVPMGNAADNWEILLQPYELLDLYPMLAQLATQARNDGIHLVAGNNIGYYGPYERLLRGGGEWTFWRGCHAGLNSLGIEADGAIKGCPSLPTIPYTGGNIREKSLREIITQTEQLNFNMNAKTAEGTDHLWGFCQTCEYAKLCRGGCSWTAHTFFGRRGNNPYCHHRALKYDENGQRERLVLKRRAEGLPFDYGEFEAVVEFVDARPQQHDESAFSAAKILWEESDVPAVPRLISV